MSDTHAQPSYNLFGSTPAVPVALTDDFTDNSQIIFSQGFDTIRIEGRYTPNAASTNAYVLLEVATSEDEGLDSPTTFYQVSGLNATSVEVDAYTDSGTGMGTGSGIPIIIPGDKTSVGARAIDFSMNLEVNSRWVRLRVKESVSADFGTLASRVKLQTT